MAADDGGVASPPPPSWAGDDLDEVERNERKNRLPMLLGVLGVAIAVVTAYVVIAKPFEAQRDRVWPDAVNGRPAGLGEIDELAEAVTPEEPTGAYLWSDFDGWHLWFVLDPTFSAVSGTIVSNADVSDTVLTPAAAGDVRAVDRTITFDIDTSSNLAGIDFEPGFYADRLEVTIEGPDGPVPVEMIHLGRDRQEAERPLVIEKVEDPGDS